MANIVEFEVKNDISGLVKFMKLWPDVAGGVLAFIGKRGRQTLKGQLLSGQELELNKFPTDSKGRYTITSNVNKKRTSTKISSYPVNLFENGRKLRSGKIEPGQKIITGKLKILMSGKIQGWASEYQARFIDKELKKI